MGITIHDSWIVEYFGSRRCRRVDGLGQSEQITVRSIQGGTKSKPKNFCPYHRQILTDFRNVSTGTFCGKCVIEWVTGSANHLPMRWSTGILDDHLVRAMFLAEGFFPWSDLRVCPNQRRRRRLGNPSITRRFVYVIKSATGSAPIVMIAPARCAHAQQQRLTPL